MINICFCSLIPKYKRQPSYEGIYCGKLEVRRIDSRITADNYTFDTVKEFIYLCSAVTTKNDVSLEIKRRITLANRSYYGLNGQLSNREVSNTNN